MDTLGRNSAANVQSLVGVRADTDFGPNRSMQGLDKCLRA